MQDEKRLREALFFANACGALTVTERGAIPALPTKDAVLRFLPKVAAWYKKAVNNLYSFSFLYRPTCAPKSLRSNELALAPFQFLFTTLFIIYKKFHFAPSAAFFYHTCTRRINPSPWKWKPVKLDCEI